VQDANKHLGKGDDPSLAINNDIKCHNVPMQCYNAQGMATTPKAEGSSKDAMCIGHLQICAMKSTMGERSIKNDSKPHHKSIQVPKITKQARVPK
jgi:hypothetical protein